MAKKKKSKVGLIIVVVILLAAIAAGVVFVGLPYLRQMQALYDRGVAYMQAENYRDAYTVFTEAGDFKDAAAQALEASAQMDAAAQELTGKAQSLADMGFKMVAGLYLTEKLAQPNRVTLADYNEMAILIGEYYADAQAQYDAVIAVEEKMTKTTMEEVMPRLEALEDSKDPVEALQVMAMITTPRLASELFEKCWANGTFSQTSLEDLAQGAPYWVPVMDQLIPIAEGADIVEVAERP